MYDEIIISGGCGRLALGIMERLSPKVHNIYALDLNTPLKEKLDKIVNARFLDYSTFLNDFVIPKNSLFIHAGFARKSIGDQLSDSLDLTGKLFRKLSFSDAHIINISSQAVYTSNRQPWIEGMHRNPNDLYGLAKTATEVLLANLCPSHIRTNIRLIALSGEAYPEHVLYKMVNYAVKNNIIFVKGNNKYFSFMDYRDAIDALCSIITSEDKNWAPQYNVGNSLNYNIVDIAKKIQSRCQQLLDRDIEINIEEDSLEFDYKMDAGCFMKKFLWQPHYLIEDSIDAIIRKISLVND